MLSTTPLTLGNESFLDSRAKLSHDNRTTPIQGRVARTTTQYVQTLRTNWQRPLGLPVDPLRTGLPSSHKTQTSPLPCTAVRQSLRLHDPSI